MNCKNYNPGVHLQHDELHQAKLHDLDARARWNPYHDRSLDDEPRDDGHHNDESHNDRPRATGA